MRVHGCRRRTSDPPSHRRHQLQVLAHPLRTRLLGALRLHGPATSTALAARLGTNSGATSYHLRQLAEAGLIEDDPERSNGRDRWWRAAHDATSWTSADFEDDPDARAADDWLLRHHAHITGALVAPVARGAPRLVARVARRRRPVRLPPRPHRGAAPRAHGRRCTRWCGRYRDDVASAPADGAERVIVLHARRSRAPSGCRERRRRCASIRRRYHLAARAAVRAHRAGRSPSFVLLLQSRGLVAGADRCRRPRRRGS